MSTETIPRGDPTPTRVALATTLGLAAASWAAVGSVTAMDEMGATARNGLGSLASSAAWSLLMMAAMMLPGAAPAAVRQARVDGRVWIVARFVGTYLAVWTVVGVATSALSAPAGSFAAGATVVAAGCYELTPLKRHFRRRCRANVRSGWEFAVSCVGSSLGLMFVLGALGAMSLAWMVVIAAVVLAQKLLPPKPAVDVPLALAAVGLGAVIILAPASVPGLMPPM